MDIQRLNKRIRRFILCFFALLILIQNRHVYAESTTITCTYIPGRQIYYVDGQKYDTPQSHFLRADGIPAYCIQPKIPDIYHPIGYESEDADWTRMSELDQNILLAYAYFGYGFDEERTNERYLAAQDLIWEYLGATDISRTGIDTTSKKEEILALTDRLRSLPILQMEDYRNEWKTGSFFEVEVNGNIPVHVANTYGDLSDFDIVLENAALVDQFGEVVTSIQGNDFYIMVPIGQQASVRFVNKLLQRNTEGGENQIIYRSAINQDVIKAGKLHVNSAEIKLNAVGAEVVVHKHDADTMQETTQGDAESFAGTGYELFDETDRNVAGILQIQENGQSNVIRGLNIYHQYSIREITAARGYVLKPEKINVDFQKLSFDSNRLIVNTTNDVITGRFQIHKVYVDRDHSAMAINEANAEFTAILQKHIIRYGSFEEALKHLNEFNTKEYAVITTDHNGIARSGPLAYGKYTVRQTAAQNTETELLKEEFIFEVNAEDQPDIKYEISNISKEYYLRLVKKDAETNELIDYHSAGFKIKDEAGNIVVQRVGDQIYDVFQTSSEIRQSYPKGTFYAETQDGTVTVPLKLKPGKYTLLEVNTPSGFMQIEREIPFELKQMNVVNVDDQDNQYITVEIPNQRIYGQLRIRKTVEEYQSDKELIDRQNLAGIAFQLIAAEDIIEPVHGNVVLLKGQPYAEIVTDETGEAILANIPLGNYILRETETPEGMVTDSTEHLVELVASESQEPAVIKEIHIENRVTKTEITKTMLTGSAETAGAELTLKDETGNVIDRWVSEYQKAHKISGLSASKTYTLHEENTVAGYYYSEDISFTVNADGSVNHVEMIDKPIHYIIEKIDDHTGKAVAGVQLQLKDLTTGETIELPDRGITGDEPMECIRNLQADHEYALEEVEIIQGVHRADILHFKVPKYNPTSFAPITVRMIDQLTGVSVMKVDENGNFIDGAELEVMEAICDESGNFMPKLDENGIPVIVYTFITSKNAANDISPYVKGGYTYILHEKKAPFGYEPMDSDIFFTVSGTKEQQQIIQAIDRAKKIYLKVKKVDADDEDIVLADTTFTVYRENGEIARDIYGNEMIGITNQAGSTEFEIPYSAETYYILETDAPEGYAISLEHYEIADISEKNFTADTPIEITVADKKEKDIPTGQDIHLIIWMSIFGGIFGIFWTIFKPDGLYRG